MLPYLFGLSVALPTLGFVYEMSGRSGRHVFLAVVAVGGAVLIHPVAGLISMIGLGGLARLRRSSLIKWAAAGLLFSSVLFYLAGPDARGYLRDGLVAGNSTSTTTGASLARALVLGNDWTRAQPLLMLMGTGGLIHATMKRGALMRIITSSSLLLYIAWLTHGHQGLLLRTIRSPFYGDWYRILGALELFLVPGVALSVESIMELRASRLKTAAICGTAVVFLLSSTTGLRIVSQAWSRPVAYSSAILKDFESIPATLRAPILNDPKDGSSWAYVSSPLVLLAPVDRSPDDLYGRVIDNLLSSAARPAVCATIVNTGARYVSLTTSRQGLADSLRENGVIDGPVFKGKVLSLHPFSSAFLGECEREARICVRQSTAPEWLAPLVEQRFSVPPDRVFCRN